MIDINNFTTSRFDNFDINLVQKEVGGGVVTVSQIDKSIKEKPNAKSIVISGLKQDTFDYFVHKYGRQFEAISFWKNKLVSDLSSLGSLDTVIFSIGDAVWANTEIESLKPIARSVVTHFECYAGILDNDYKCLANGNLLELDMNPTQFTMEELAEFLSLFPVSLKGTVTKPYVEKGITDVDGNYTKCYFLCKNKKKMH